MSAAAVPGSVEELSNDYLSAVASKLLGEPVRVTDFTVTPDPFEFPRFGDKQFYEIAFAYQGESGEGRSTLILRVLPEMDAVMMLTGDTEHRELKAMTSETPCGRGFTRTSRRCSFL